MNTSTKLKLEPVHKDMLNEIRNNGQGSLVYYKRSFSAPENKAINQLIEAGLVLKTVQRIQYMGRFSTKITLSVKGGLNPIDD